MRSATKPHSLAGFCTRHRLARRRNLVSQPIFRSFGTRLRGTTTVYTSNTDRTGSPSRGATSRTARPARHNPYDPVARPTDGAPLRSRPVGRQRRGAPRLHFRWRAASTWRRGPANRLTTRTPTGDCSWKTTPVTGRVSELSHQTATRSACGPSPPADTAGHRNAPMPMLQLVNRPKKSQRTFRPVQ